MPACPHFGIIFRIEIEIAHLDLELAATLGLAIERARPLAIGRVERGCEAGGFLCRAGRGRRGQRDLDPQDVELAGNIRVEPLDLRVFCRGERIVDALFSHQAVDPRSKAIGIIGDIGFVHPQGTVLERPELFELDLYLRHERGGTGGCQGMRQAIGCGRDRGAGYAFGRSGLTCG